MTRVAGRVGRPVPHRPARGGAGRPAGRAGRRRGRRGPVPRGADRPGGGVHDGRPVGPTTEPAAAGGGGRVNPIVRRELLDLLRTRKAAGRCRSAWPWPAPLLVLRPLADRRGRRPDRGPVRSRCCACSATGCWPASCSWCPAFPATAHRPREGQGDAGAAAQLAAVGRWSIYLGKLGGVLGFTAVLLVMTLPGRGRLLRPGRRRDRGGVGAAVRRARRWRPCSSPTLGLLVSSRAQSTDGALRVDLRPGAGRVRAAARPALAAARRRRARSPTLADWLRCLSPVPAVMEVLGHGGVGTHGMAAGRRGGRPVRRSWPA